MDTYRVLVSKDYLTFSSAHFITYGGGKCEALHGHNYRAGVTLTGELDEHALVFDFSVLKRLLKEIVDGLDHRMLLPTGNPLLDVDEVDGEVEVRFRERRYRFPRADVVRLPIPNTTAEMLASHIADRLLEALSAEGAPRFAELRVEVEESPGQSAWCIRTPGAGSESPRAGAGSDSPRAGAGSDSPGAGAGSDSPGAGA